MFSWRSFTGNRFTVTEGRQSFLHGPSDQLSFQQTQVLDHDPFSYLSHPCVAVNVFKGDHFNDL